jgi:hypothetical protein
VCVAVREIIALEFDDLTLVALRAHP